ncbi:hypothetical protein Tco_0818929, partial [Tanacetum coccineum]
MVSAVKDLLTFNNLMATSIDLSKYAMNRLKINKLTKAHLVGLVYNLLKEGDRCPYDLSKPLPLKGHICHLTVPSEYFFNNDLEYLKSSDPEKKYTRSIMKTKAARYELVGIENMIPNIWSATKAKELYTQSFDPPGAVYEDLNKRKRVMRADELYKFSDRTLKLVRDELPHRVLNFCLGYNDEMSRRKCQKRRNLPRDIPLDRIEVL